MYIQLNFLFILTTVLCENRIPFSVDRCRGLEEFRDKINCSYHPDDYLDVPQIIRRHGYSVESHLVISGSGYLLGLHRIPGSKNGTQGRQPVLLQHGLFGSSADWILNGDNALGYTLADQGYDVWLGNDRGNTYSRGHISIPNWSEQYWNFSWHEMATIDLPQVIYYIENTTKRPGEVIYIGHSMGGTEFFAFASTLPSVAKRIKLMIGLAPAVYMTHLKSPIRYLAPFANDVTWIAKRLGIKMLLPNNDFIKLLAYECTQNKEKKLCQHILFIICGGNATDLNIDIMPTVIAHDPAGTSVKTLIHYAQEIKNDGKFQQYDYGPEGNMIQYGTLTPPEYPLKDIKTPIYLMYSKNDTLVSYIDILRLSTKLQKLVGLYQVPSASFSHVDFVFGNDAYKIIYKPILNILRNYTLN